MKSHLGSPPQNSRLTPLSDIPLHPKSKQGSFVVQHWGGFAPLFSDTSMASSHLFLILYQSSSSFIVDSEDTETQPVCSSIVKIKDDEI